MPAKGAASLPVGVIVRGGNVGRAGINTSARLAKGRSHARPSEGGCLARQGGCVAARRRGHPRGGCLARRGGCFAASDVGRWAPVVHRRARRWWSRCPSAGPSEGGCLARQGGCVAARRRGHPRGGCLARRGGCFAASDVGRWAPVVHRAQTQERRWRNAKMSSGLSFGPNRKWFRDGAGVCVPG